MRITSNEDHILPRNWIDTHAHVIGSEIRYPLAKSRSYTPRPRSVFHYLREVGTLGIKKTILVQPSFYGLDNSLLLDTLKKFPSKFKGVAVVNSKFSEYTLDFYKTCGIKGVRLNLLFSGGVSIEELEKMAIRLAKRDIHIEILINIDIHWELIPRLLKLKIPLVFDHMGHFDLNKKSSRFALKRLKKLLQSEDIWVKLSAPYRFSTTSATNYFDVAQLMQELIEANSNRILWGSDWPHTATFSKTVSAKNLLKNFLNLVSNPELTHQILEKNPQKLYKF